MGTEQGWREVCAATPVPCRVRVAEGAFNWTEAVLGTTPGENHLFLEQVKSACADLQAPTVTCHHCLSHSYLQTCTGLTLWESYPKYCTGSCLKG